MAFKSFADQFIDAVKDQINENMQNVTSRYRELLGIKLDTPPARTGKIYGNHQASAPGEPPAPLTGELRDTLKEMILNTGVNFHSAVYSELDRAVWLEKGTGERYTRSGRYTGRVDPRPAWHVTLTENKDELADIATEGFERKA